MQNRKTQIYGTFGPACKSREILEEMIKCGMTGMRLNLSHTTLEKSKEYIENYFIKHPNVKKFMDKSVDDARSQGFVETVFKRRRYIPEITSSNFVLRGAGERMAMNTPIQGSAADIIKIAMVSVYNALKKLEKSKLILQVHDELIIEAHESEAEEAKKILTECMEKAVDLVVPMVAEANVGKSWYEAK